MEHQNVYREKMSPQRPYNICKRKQTQWISNGLALTETMTLERVKRYDVISFKSWTWDDTGDQEALVNYIRRHAVTT